MTGVGKGAKGRIQAPALPESPLGEYRIGALAKRPARIGHFARWIRFEYLGLIACGFDHGKTSKVISEHVPVARFTTTLAIPRSKPYRKTGRYLSLREACQVIGIDPKTYRRKEGKLFPEAKRLPNRFRFFTREEVRTLSKIWRERERNC